MQNQLISQKIRLSSINKPLNGELSDKIYYSCRFCEKLVMPSPTVKRMCETLVGDNSFHCSFCIRNKFHTRNNRDILVLSFRSIIGYYYYFNYQTKPRRMYLSEIEDYISVHKEVGLQNPLFSYDDETYLWYVDFSRIGKSKKKVPVENTMQTVNNILACFNLYRYISGNVGSLSMAYSKAIEKFYANRIRPDDKKFLIPTFSNFMSLTEPQINAIRSFTSNDLKMRS